VPIYNTSKTPGYKVLSNIPSWVKDYNYNVSLENNIYILISNRPVPMKIVAGGGALPFALVWKGVAVDVGSESITTRTGRCRRRDSVKNLA
jgi:hypothetical protein